MDPLLQAYNMQKANAQNRGIEWQLEYWEWLQIWQDSGHLHERGKQKNQYVMSRPGDTGPYAAGNVRIVHCETNNEEAARGRVARRKASRPPLIQSSTPSKREP